MKFALEEIEVIKDALIVSLNHQNELENIEMIVKILDRIDDENGLD
jgi:hypothetical protein